MSWGREPRGLCGHLGQGSGAPSAGSLLRSSARAPDSTRKLIMVKIKSLIMVRIKYTEIKYGRTISGLCLSGNPGFVVLIRQLKRIGSEGTSSTRTCVTPSSVLSSSSRRNSTPAGPNLLCQSSKCVPQSATFRRAPVQIKAIEAHGLIPLSTSTSSSSSRSSTPAWRSRGS